MPAVANGGDELGPGDEIKVFKDEGEDEQEQGGSESLQAELLEEKSSLITESEQFSGKPGELRRPEASNPFSMPGFPGPFGMGYLVNPYAAYANGAMGRAGSPLSPFLPDPLGSPPPAHMGSLSYDKATMAAALRPPLYALPGQYPYPALGMEQLAAWHRNPYSVPLSSAPGSPMARFSPSMLPPHMSPFGGMPPHHLPHIKQEYGDRPPHLIHHDDKDGQSPKKKEPHIKKPLNAFMLYMKEMRSVVQAECTLKESAAINQILGRRWHGLTREEQAKYYEKARQERQRHMQMYPHWNARDNYRYGQKKKKRKRDKTDDPAANMKKCRARYGLDQQNLWCKPCRRKKKCVRVQMYLAGRSEQEIEATTFDEDGEAITPTGLGMPVPGQADESSNGSDGEGGSPAGSLGSSEHSLTSPMTPGGTLGSLGSPASLASPGTPGDGAGGWEGYRRGPGGHRPPVGTDPRDSNNPLSISSLTSRDMVPSPSNPYTNGHHSEKLLGVI